MKVEARLFELLTVFFALAGVAYTLFTTFTSKGTEWVGVVGMFFSAGLTLIAGTYFRFVARRVEIRPEDFEDALRRAGGFDESEALAGYQRWMATDPFDAGNTCRSALERGEKDHGSQANGALMRISPLAVAYAGKPGEAERGPRKASQTKSVDNPRQPAELSTDLETPGTRVQFPH